MKNSELTHTASCPLCNRLTKNILTKHLRRGKGVVFFCAECHHGFLTPDVDFDTKSYYAESYRQEYSHNAAPAVTNAQEIFDVYRHYQNDRIDATFPYLKTTTRLLEVGASSGQFLINIKDQIATVHAIELDKACCDFMQNQLGIQADSEYLRGSIFSDEHYDVVCSFQVLEHTPDPVDFLKELRQSTEKGGKIFVEVPNLHDALLSIWDSASYKNFFFHSAHLHYFTEDSLRKSAEIAGFLPEQVEIKFSQDYNLLNHLNWLTNNAPQATCDIGLNKIDLVGSSREISSWLTEKMRALNDEYIKKLVVVKATSNLMMVLSND